MAIGYFLVRGDKTTCGGVIIEGADDHTIMGIPQAREFDSVTCGRYSGVYKITGGVPETFLHNKMMAGTLHSMSSCPCRSRFIASQLNDTYETGGGDSEPTQHAQSAHKTNLTAPAPEQEKQKEKREVTLTIGIFFDGTGNNAINAANTMKACTAEHYHISGRDAEMLLGKCARDKFGVSGIGATSYLGYYTNVHWLATLYKTMGSVNDTNFQKELYIDGIGTKAGEPDSMLAQALGCSDTGVLAKAENAISKISGLLAEIIEEIVSKLPNQKLIIQSLQFDIFGFSRGAAAARHFANRVYAQDPAIISAIQDGIRGISFAGMPAGKTRFIGIFDTVAAIGTPTNGFNPHNADTGAVNIALRPGVAEKVFHITAAHECRFNFALNSVKPAWPELALPGVHSDIGGGYLPLLEENLFLTRPQTDTVPLRQPGEETRGYHQTLKQMAILDNYPCIAPIMHTSEISAETWFDDRMPSDRYGEPQKRSYAALTLRHRNVKNDLSKVVLRVMLDAAQDAGVLFKPITSQEREMTLPDELTSVCEKAISMGKAVRSGQQPEKFSETELNLIATNYIHCSAHWNAILTDSSGVIRGGVSPAELIGFVNRPDENWTRTIYNMDGKHA
ncbi:MAG: DUF2235 domain-containing protein [Enterobacteriaceae bacterium]|nr:DUF2235 domain-containing protein [Enterobacteriaceae bacterium]